MKQPLTLLPCDSPEVSSIMARLRAFTLGQHVRVCGLVNRPELNSCCGVISSGPSSGRFGVRLSDGSSLAIKPVNMEPIHDAVNAHACHATGLPDLQREIQQSDQEVKNRRRALIGLRVKLCGISDNPELNGRHGRCLSVDGDDLCTVDLETPLTQTKHSVDSQFVLSSERGYAKVKSFHLEVAPSASEADLQAALYKAAENGFHDVAWIVTAMAARSGTPSSSVELKLPEGSRHHAAFIKDPKGLIAGTLSTCTGPCEDLTRPWHGPPLVRTFIHGRYVADEGNAGLVADWKAADGVDWNSHTKRFQALPIHKQLSRVVTAPPTFMIDRPSAPRLLTVRGQVSLADGVGARDVEMSILVSPCTLCPPSMLHMPDAHLWTSAAHARSLDGQPPVLQGRQSRLVTRSLVIVGLEHAVSEGRAAESWILAAFANNMFAQKYPQLAAAAYLLHVDIMSSFPSGAHSRSNSLLGILMMRAGEALEACNDFAGAAEVYEREGRASDLDMMFSGGWEHVAKPWSNAGLARKRAKQYGRSEANYNHALRRCDDAQASLSADKSRAMRNAVLRNLGQLYRATDSRYEQHAVQLIDVRQQDTKEMKVMMELFGVELARATGMTHKNHLFTWGGGGVPRLHIPSLGRSWHLNGNDVVEELTRRAPESITELTRRLKTEAGAWAPQPSEAERMRTMYLQQRKSGEEVMSNCNGCGKAISQCSAKKCARCLVTVYCSKECQKAAWKAHKKVCAHTAAAEEDTEQ